MIEDKYGLIHNEQSRKIHNLTEKVSFHDHVYTYFGHTYGTYAIAERSAQKLRDEGLGSIVHTSKDGLHGVYIRRK